MTENRKKIFTDCQAELIRLESQPVIVTSGILGGKDDWSKEQDGGLIDTEKQVG